MSGQASSALAPERSVAILLLSIDADHAATVLRQMGEDALSKVTRAMRELEEATVDSDAIGKAYEEFVEHVESGGMVLGDVAGLMRMLLVKAFGEEKGAKLTTQSNSEILVRKPFAVFEGLPPDDLADLLVEEHPQIAAVFVAHLDRTKAAEVLKNLPEDKRGDLIQRIATLDRTPPDVVQRVLDVMRKKVKDLGLTSLRSEPKAWIKAAAEILNNLGGGEKAILEMVQDADEQIATAIRDEMFTFDDLGKLERKSMQKILSEVDTRVLAMSLKAASSEVEQTVFGNLSKRAAAMVAEERDSLGPTPLSTVLEAQAEILMIVRDLLDKGEVSATMGAGDQLV